MAACADTGETYEFWPELLFHKWFNERRSRALAEARLGCIAA